MGIQMIGIDHMRAGIDVRSIFSFTKKAMTEAYEKVQEMKEIKGCVILSTCNRMELWVSVREDCKADLEKMLCELKQVSGEAYSEFFIQRSGREAVQHLFRLASGLESRILGEDQIITQVKEALTFAREQEMSDHVLEVLFRMAVTAGKKVKTTVPLSTASQSVIHQAVKAMKQQGYEFTGKTCMVIGNGAMGKLTASTLQQEGCNVTVTVRQYRSGIVDIPRECSRINYGERMGFIKNCDLVVSATSSPNYTITKSEMEQADIRKPLLMIDLAVPRDIEAEVGSLPGITVHDIDYYQVELIGDSVMESIARAEAILAEQENEFFDWYEGRDLVSRIQKIKQGTAQDLNLRLSRILKSLPLKETEEKTLEKEIDSAAERVMNKLLFELKDEMTEQSFCECLAAMEKIYHLG